MYELLLLAVLVLLVGWLISGKSAVVFENPIIIQEVGSYYATVAPQFAQSQCFIVQIATRFRPEDVSDVAALYFDVHDAGLHYLMAVTRRAQVLYFQIIGPEFGDVQVLRSYSEQVLVHHPLNPPVHEPGYLHNAVCSAARELKIDCVNLQ
jgi:hypothetical protein